MTSAELTSISARAQDVRKDSFSPVENTLSDERSKAEQERISLAQRVADKTHEIGEIDRLMSDLSALRQRRVEERGELIEAHSIKLQSVAALTERAMRSHNA